MYLKEIEIINYRLHNSLKIGPLAQTNLLLGNNGQGKSSALEAIHLLFGVRRAANEEIISFGQEQAVVRGRLLLDNQDREISVCVYKNKTKTIKVDKKEAKKTPEKLKTVLFNPDDTQALKQGPGRRRELIDEIMGQIDHKHTYWLNQYNANLRQRNALLKSPNASHQSLEAFSQKLVEAAEKVINGRLVAIKEATPLYNKYHQKISGNNKRAELKYQTSLDTKDIKGSLVLRLKETRQEEAARRQTLAGPHLDDIIFFEEGINIKKFGSQGEKKTAALSIRLAQYELIKKKLGAHPVVLLDDLVSELDAGRRARLLGAPRGAGQVIISSTDEEITAEEGDGKVAIHRL
ncbi:MAG: DNA replication and repair protein RecF [Actinobacteria bacterium]|nr:MAG: DNA replication and repair protein RecF [Actinomycetota bacterium]